MKNIIISSFNLDKIHEFNHVLEFNNINDFKFLSIAEFIKDQEIKPPEEIGQTLKDNALIKLKFAMNLVKDEIIISDDSGFYVDALDGKPGIYAARFGGNIDDYAKNKLILNLMKNKKINRKAYYETVICCYIPGYDCICVNNILNGMISKEMKGNNGFAYDSIFYIPQYNKTIGQMDDKLIINIIPRSKAILKIIKKLREQQI